MSAAFPTPIQTAHYLGTVLLHLMMIVCFMHSLQLLTCKFEFHPDVTEPQHVYKPLTTQHHVLRVAAYLTMLLGKALAKHFGACFTGEQGQTSSRKSGSASVQEDGQACDVQKSAATQEDCAGAG